jgi:hypothetical protein
MRLIIVLLLLAGCASTAPTPTPIPTSAWGITHTIAQTPQTDAPAMWADHQRVVTAWIQDAHLNVRIFQDGQWSQVIVLPLTLRNPRDLKIVRGNPGSTHLLWIDMDENGETRVFSAYLTRDLELERGLVKVSNRRSESYDVSVNGDGSLWVVWNGGLQSERSLYANFVDVVGRPRETQHLMDNADYPALASGEVFWISVNTVYRARLDERGLHDIQAHVENVALAPGDWLVNFEAVDDYLFWNIVRADGSVETWFSWNGVKPQLLTVSYSLNETMQTGFNSGTVFKAQSGEMVVKWAVPLAGQKGILPIVAQVGENLSIVYLENGTAAGYQAITRADLIGLPAIATDINRHLYVAWAQPSGDTAALQVTMTR